MDVSVLKALRTVGLCGVLSLTTLAIWSPPAAGQSTVEEVTVTGRLGPGGRPQSLSQKVSYSDLDLSTRSGQTELRHRVRLTARYLCQQLGEADSPTGPGPSCRTAAQTDGLRQADSVISTARPRGPQWVHGKGWVAPYPEDWDKKYE